MRPDMRTDMRTDMRNFLIIALASLTAAGQQTPAPQAPALPTTRPAAGMTTFKAEASLVVVDVTVKDKAGKLIEDLKGSDFTLLEDGKPQKISVFEFEKLATDPAPPEAPPTLEDVNAIPEAPVKTITAESPGKAQYHDKRLMVLFFDLGSMGI